MAPKRVTSGGANLRGLAPGQHSSEETSQRRRTVGGTASDLTGPGIEPQISRTDSDAYNDLANRQNASLNRFSNEYTALLEKCKLT